MHASVDDLALWKEVSMKSPDKALAGSPRWQVRGKEEFTADELAQLQEKLEGWVQQTVPKAETKRSRYQFVMKHRNTGKA